MKPETHRRILHTIGLALLALSVILTPPQPASAQQAGRIILLPPNTQAFPEIEFTFEAYTASGQFLPDLQPNQLRVLENGQPQPLTALDRLEPGLQFIVAVNPAPLMATQVAGVSHYQQIQGALQVWVTNLGSEAPNDYSLATNTGLQVIREKDPAAFAAALGAYNPDLLNAQAALVSLTQALDLASDPNPVPNMKRAVLYITTPPNAALQEALPNLTSRAAQMGVRIYVWMVAPPNAAGTPAADVLLEMAGRTGGEFFVFTGSEPLPNLETYLWSQRYLYQGRYRSALQQSGTARLQIEIQQDQLQAVSPETSFELQLQPPNPMFLAPPVRLEQQWVQVSRTEAPILGPPSVELRILVEFPDGRPRELRLSRLYVDGAVAAENTQPPFDVFRWPLTAYTESGTHQLKVEVEDEIGLRRASINIPVEVVVPAKPSGLMLRLMTDRGLQTGLAVGAAVLVLAVVFALSARRILRALPRLPKKRQPTRDPLTQVVRIPQETSSTAYTSVGSPSLPRTLVPTPAQAYLQRLGEDGNPLSGSIIPLTQTEITFGSDPAQAIQVIDSPSVSPLHARLITTSEGYRLADAGSVAGTWLNYAPVSSLGARLEHGDLIHFGRASFRFQLSRPGRARKIQAQPYQDTLE